MSGAASLAKKLASCRNFTEICQLATTYALTDASFSAAMLASLDADGRIRELGRFSIVGEGHQKNPWPSRVTASSPRQYNSPDLFSCPTCLPQHTKTPSPLSLILMRLFD